MGHLSISNNTNGSICMTGFVTWQIRCQTRLNITPACYHNRLSNECSRWCERPAWIRKGLLHAAQRGVSITRGLNQRCGPPLWPCWGLCDFIRTRQRHTHIRRKTVWLKYTDRHRTACFLHALTLNANAQGHYYGGGGLGANITSNHGWNSL